MEENNTWNFLCILFDYVDVTIEKDQTMQNIKLSLTETDKKDIKTCMKCFQSSMEEMSKGKIQVKYDIEESFVPITSLSFDEKNGYYVSGYNVREVLNPYLAQGKYDHIFLVFRTGDINQKGAIPVNDWIGLRFHGISRNRIF